MAHLTDLNCEIESGAKPILPVFWIGSFQKKSFLDRQIFILISERKMYVNCVVSLTKRNTVRLVWVVRQFKTNLSTKQELH